jgi:DNA polymerase
MTPAHNRVHEDVAVAAVDTDGTYVQDDIGRSIHRFLEDLVAFEGPSFVLPAASQPLEGATLDSTGVDSGRVDSAGDLEQFHQEICHCQACGLGQTRQHFVFGSGAADADIMFIGEAPGADEDRQGMPFVGKAGQLLTKIIEAMQLQRQDVYICNMLKCRPPNNRDPLPEEIASCEPYLKRQIEIVQPAIICTLGRIATQAVLKTTESMARLRGTLHEYEGIPVIATYHPAALLRNPAWKRETWEDMKWLRREYDGTRLS